MGLFKILQAAAVHNNKSAGGREGESGRRRGKGGGSGKHHGLSLKNGSPEMAGGAATLKCPRGERKGEGDTPERWRRLRRALTAAGGLERPAWKAASPKTSGKDVIPLNPLRWLWRALSHATGCPSRLPQITGV